MIDKVVVGDLDTNCWIIRDQETTQAAIIDPGAEPDRILQAVQGMHIKAIVLTHAHYDHALALPAVATALNAPILGHPKESTVWENEVAHLHQYGHFDAGTATADLLEQGKPPKPQGELWNGTLDRELKGGETLTIGATDIHIKHTPGHSPGSLCLATKGHLFTGDTLFPGGPGLTGAQWPLTSFDDIMRSVRALLDEHGPETTVHPGHGADTTVGAERPHVEEWAARGW